MTRKAAQGREGGRAQAQGASSRVRRAPMPLVRPVFFLGCMGAG